MRGLNVTTARRGGGFQECNHASVPRSAKARALFSRDQGPKSRIPNGDDVGKPCVSQAAGGGWFGAAPQVRGRLANDRAKQQLGELALLNETLLGEDSWRIRKKVEYLKSKRKAWEGVYNAACKQEVSLTVAHLESAMAEVRTQ